MDLDPSAGGLGFLMKVNPQHQLFSSMKLFMEAQVRVLSYSRYKGADGLAAEIRLRQKKAQEAKLARRMAQEAALSAPAGSRKRQPQSSARDIDVSAAIRAAIDNAHVCAFKPQLRPRGGRGKTGRGVQEAQEHLRVMECSCGASYEEIVIVRHSATVVID